MAAHRLKNLKRGEILLHWKERENLAGRSHQNSNRWNFRPIANHRPNCRFRLTLVEREAECSAHVAEQKRVVVRALQKRLYCESLKAGLPDYGQALSRNFCRPQ